MGTYKGITFSDRVAPLVRHMPVVDDHREALAALAGAWDTLALLAQLSRLEADVDEVRASFAELTGELLASLGEELLALADAMLGHRAQIALDLLARNLFEPCADEAAGIFERLATRDEVLAFVDVEGRVVVSSDAARLPPGRRPAWGPGAATLRLGGVTHLAAQRKGRPDQGDAASGWSVLALSPVELAFGQDATGASAVAFSGATVFSQRLLGVPERVREIQRRLDRTVWNVRLRHGAEANAFSRRLLEEIAATGRKTREQFERAVSELLAIAASRLLAETCLLADLSVELLDRHLHEGAPRQPEAGHAVDGIARVLDGSPQFDAMLRAALPARAGAVAACCRRDGAVIGRTGDLPVTLPTSVLSLQPGPSWSGVLVEDGHGFVVGASAGRADRGFMKGDEIVIGVVVVPCGHAAASPAAVAPQIANVPGGSEIATFLIGDHLLGVPARDVIDCVAVTAPVRVWRGGFAQRHVGFLTWNDSALPLVDIAADVHAAGAEHRHALVLEAGAQRFGLLVSELGPIADMKLTEERHPCGHGDATRLIAQLARSGPVIIPVLSPEAIFGGPAG